MQIRRRLRGLLGAAAIWGAVGALIGATMFVVRYRPWTIRFEYLSRMLELLGLFLGLGALWGSVCGLAFGVAVWSLGRRSTSQPLTPRNFTLWGAVAGAAFPFAIYSHAIVTRGIYGAIPFFSMITGISALIGAVCARTVFAMARRAPELRSAPEMLAAASPGGVGELSFETAERERVR